MFAIQPYVYIQQAESEASACESYATMIVIITDIVNCTGGLR